MTPDEIVAEIFRIQEERNPDADPGDLWIDVQDDMPLANVGQHRTYAYGPLSDAPERDFSTALMLQQGTFGDTIQEALENYLKEVKDGTR